MYKPDTRPLSRNTGYLFSMYLEMKRTAEQLQQVCKIMENLEPWFDPEYRKKCSRPKSF